MCLITNIIDLYFSPCSDNDCYYSLVVRSGDFQSREINANLWYYSSSGATKTPYSVLEKTVIINYEYTDSNGNSVTSEDFECTVESGDYVNLISFTIPNYCLVTPGDVIAQIKVYDGQGVLNDDYDSIIVPANTMSDYGSIITPIDKIDNYGSIAVPAGENNSGVGIILLNTCVFKILVLESINIDGYEDNQVPIIGFTQQATESTLGGIKASNRGINDTAEVKIEASTGKLYVTSGTYMLPQATSSNLGGIKAETKGENDTVEAKIDATNGKLYVTPNIYTLPQATSLTLGGVKAAVKGEQDSVEAKIEPLSGKLYVAPSVYTLPQATNSTLGGIKAVAKESGDTTEVKIDTSSGKLYVTPGSYTLPQASESTFGGIKASNKTLNDTVEVKINSSNGKLYVAPSDYVLPQATSLILGGIKADEKTLVDTIPVKIDTETGILYVEPTSLAGLTANNIQTDTEEVSVQDALDSLEENKATVRWYTVSLPAIGWSETVPFTQTISVSGLLSIDIPIMDVVLSSTLETRISQRESYSYISMIESGDGELIATCDETKPTVDLTIQLEVIR